MVTIATTPGASIRYTTDGVTIPTGTVGTLYTGPVSVSASQTLKAIGYETGWPDSAVATAAYTMVAPGTTVSARDSSANGNHGALENGIGVATGWTGGAGAAAFTGSNTYIDLGTSAALMPAGSITASAWIKAPATQTTFPQILSAGDSTGLTGFNLYLWSQGYPAFIVKEGANGWGSCFVRGLAALNDNAWHLVTGVYSGTNIKVYVDGALAASSTCANQSVNYGSGPRGEIGWKLDANSNDDFNGALDEVRLSNMARSADWIATEYNNQQTPAAFAAAGPLQAQGVQAPNAISGLVTATPGGALLTGVTMTLSGVPGRSAMTNSGSYGFAALVAGGYTVTPSMAGASFSPVNYPITLPNSQSGSVNFSATGLYGIGGSGGKVGSNRGNDILFTASDGVTPLSYEFEFYAPATGQPVAWVGIPSLSSTANTVVWEYF